MQRFFLLLCASFLLQGWAHAQETKPTYALKQENADIGTNIKKDAVKNSLIPLDKKYEELSAEQKDIVKSQYENMPADDEPPFPIDGLGPIYRAIAKAQGKLAVEGPLTIFVEIGSDGIANSVSVYQSPNQQMTMAVATLLMRQKFKPALCQGQACKMQFPFRIKLSLN